MKRQIGLIDDAGWIVEDDFYIDHRRMRDDGDSYTENDGDCNDGNAAVYPGATEVCDGVANDCDDASAVTFIGAAPNDDAQACMRDADADDYGDAGATGAVTAGSVTIEAVMHDDGDTVSTIAAEGISGAGSGEVGVADNHQTGLEFLVLVLSGQGLGPVQGEIKGRAAVVDLVHLP